MFTCSLGLCGESMFGACGCFTAQKSRQLQRKSGAKFLERSEESPDVGAEHERRKVCMKIFSTVESPSTQYWKLVVPKTILLMVFGTRAFKLDPPGNVDLSRGLPFPVTKRPGRGSMESQRPKIMGARAKDGSRKTCKKENSKHKDIYIYIQRYVYVYTYIYIYVYIYIEGYMPATFNRLWATLGYSGLQSLDSGSVAVRSGKKHKKQARWSEYVDHELLSFKPPLQEPGSKLLLTGLDRVIWDPCKGLRGFIWELLTMTHMKYV